MWRRPAILVGEQLAARSARTVEALDLHASRTASTLSDRTHGRQAGRDDLTWGSLAQDVYKSTGTGFKDWKPVGEDRLKHLGLDIKSLSTSSGFVARVYEHPNEGGVVSFKGTSSMKDWIANLRQGAGSESAQYNQTISLAKEARKIFGDDLVFTGHSKGGGQAALASVVTGNSAVTFNAAGLHDVTIKHLDLDPDKVRAKVGDGQIRSYVVAGEILNKMQDGAGGLMPKSLGARIDLDDPHPQQGWTSYIPGSGVKHATELHFMSNVMDALKPYLDSQVKLPTAADALRNDPMFGQAVQAFKTAGPQHFKFGSEQALYDAAAAATVNAEVKGLQRIDAIVPSTNGRDFFVVQGSPSDPAHKRVLVDGATAAQSLQQSVAQLEQTRQPLAPQDPQTPQSHGERHR